MGTENQQNNGGSWNNVLNQGLRGFPQPSLRTCTKSQRLRILRCEQPIEPRQQQNHVVHIPSAECKEGTENSLRSNHQHLTNENPTYIHIHMLSTHTHLYTQCLLIENIWRILPVILMFKKVSKHLHTRAGICKAMVWLSLSSAELVSCSGSTRCRDQRSPGLLPHDSMRSRLFVAQTSEWMNYPLFCQWTGGVH